jgi:outer membrane protein TolC
MRALILIATPILLLAQSYTLPQLISHAKGHHQLFKVKSMQRASKNSAIDVANSSFGVNVDISASYTIVSPNSIVSPTQTLSGVLSANYEVYDGGRKEALLKATQLEHRASQFEVDAFAKSITLEIVNYYYSIKKRRAILYALQEQSKELLSQIDRIERFYETGLATIEEVDKLKAVYDNNQYLIANSKMDIVTNQEKIWLATGLRVEGLKDSHIKEPKNIVIEPYEKSKIIKLQAKAIDERSKAVDSGYMPQVNLSDSYRHSNYSGVDSIAGFGDGLLIEDENRLTLSVGMRVFDYGKIKHQSEVLKYQKLATSSEQIYAKQEQQMQFNIAKHRLHTIRDKYKSTKSAFKATTSTYNAILKKFEVGMVDNITYLDALNSLTLAKARVKETLYDYEIAKSIFYYYAGKNPEEYIR